MVIVPHIAHGNGKLFFKRSAIDLHTLSPHMKLFLWQNFGTKLDVICPSSSEERDAACLKGIHCLLRRLIVPGEIDGGAAFVLVHECRKPPAFPG